jgi:hypothetical protein
MPLFTKHRAILYTKQGDPIAPDDHAVGDKVQGFSNKKGKASRRPITFEVTQGPDGKKQFTLKGLF